MNITSKVAHTYLNKLISLAVICRCLLIVYLRACLCHLYYYVRSL